MRSSVSMEAGLPLITSGHTARRKRRCSRVRRRVGIELVGALFESLRGGVLL